ncbi:hypothetical protein RHECNPAF_1330053 [Rhizobium etli CNPAF512]|nr:hypothetical protein RHECNPAF_1330053 [Rhizobium etli CNPAF512]
MSASRKPPSDTTPAAPRTAKRAKGGETIPKLSRPSADDTNRVWSGETAVMVAGPPTTSHCVRFNDIAKL